MRTVRVRDAHCTVWHLCTSLLDYGMGRKRASVLAFALGGRPGEGEIGYAVAYALRGDEVDRKSGRRYLTGTFLDTIDSDLTRLST